MGESRWMKQTNSKIRIGPEYQAVLPDLSVPEKNIENKKNNGSKTTNINVFSSSSSSTSKITTNGYKNREPKNSAQSSIINIKTTKSEGESTQINKTLSSESTSKPKNSTKTQKTISKTKANNKNSSRSSK